MSVVYYVLWLERFDTETLHFTQRSERRQRRRRLVFVGRRTHTHTHSHIRWSNAGSTKSSLFRAAPPTQRTRTTRQTLSLYQHRRIIRECRRTFEEVDRIGAVAIRDGCRLRRRRQQHQGNIDYVGLAQKTLFTRHIGQEASERARAWARERRRLRGRVWRARIERCFVQYLSRPNFHCRYLNLMLVTGLDAHQRQSTKLPIFPLLHLKRRYCRRYFSCLTNSQKAHKHHQCEEKQKHIQWCAWSPFNTFERKYSRIVRREWNCSNTEKNVQFSQQISLGQTQTTLTNCGGGISTNTVLSCTRAACNETKSDWFCVYFFIFCLIRNFVSIHRLRLPVTM